MKVIKPNVIDTCLHKAGFKSKNNPGAISGLFNEFQRYDTQVFNEWQEMTCLVNKASLKNLDMGTKGAIYLWNGSLGDEANRSLYFVEFSDSTLGLVQPDYESGSNYAHSETTQEEGETISECIARIGKKVNRVIHIIWNYSDWNELERYREITIYS